MPTSPHWVPANSHWIFVKSVQFAGSMWASIPTNLTKASPKTVGADDPVRPWEAPNSPMIFTFRFVFPRADRGVRPYTKLEKISEKRVSNGHKQEKLAACAVCVCGRRGKAAGAVGRFVGSERHARPCAVLLHVPPHLPVCRGRGDGGAHRALVLMVTFGVRAEDRSVLPVDRRVARYGLHNFKESPAAAGRPLPARAARQCGKPVDRRD